MKQPKASIKLPNASTNLHALRWITRLQEKVVMAKVELLVASLGRDRGTMKKIAMNKLTSEWQVRLDEFSCWVSIASD
jgi:hypothetical protein